MIITTWWAWMMAGLVLAILEVMLPSWVFLGFAIGAGATGALLLTGEPIGTALSGSVPLLMVVFAVASLVAWLALRRVFGLKTGSVKTFDHDINDT